VDRAADPDVRLLRGAATRTGSRSFAGCDPRDRSSRATSVAATWANRRSRTTSRCWATRAGFEPNDGRPWCTTRSNRGPRSGSSPSWASSCPARRPTTAPRRDPRWRWVRPPVRAEGDARLERICSCPCRRAGRGGRSVLKPPPGRSGDRWRWLAGLDASDLVGASGLEAEVTSEPGPRRATA
jgi:hypothetical protein